MWPLIELAIEPTSPADRDRLGIALGQMATEDPSLLISVDKESGQTVLHSSDEVYLDKKCDRLIHDLGLDIRVGSPQVAYRETITRRVQVDYSHKKARGARGEFARVVVIFEPGAPGSGFGFVSEAGPEKMLPAHIESVAKGLEAVARDGLLAGFPVIDIKATLVDGAYHDADSSSLTFDIAARAAFKALRKEGGPVLLAPVVKVEVSAPQACLNAILNDLVHHGGMVEASDGAVVGLVPLAGLLGYDRRLDRLTNGQGAWVMTFDHYAPVPQHTSPNDSYTPDVGIRA